MLIRFLPLFKSKIIEITAIDSKGRTLNTLWILWYLRVKPLPHVFSFLIFLLNTNQVVCFCGLVHHDPFCRSTCSQASQQSFLYPSENFEFPQWHFQKNLYASQIICVNKWTKDISETYIFNMYIQNFSSDLFFVCRIIFCWSRSWITVD